MVRLGSKLPSAVTLTVELVCVNTIYHSVSLSGLNPTLNSDGKHRTTSLLKMSRSRSLDLQHVRQLPNFFVAHPFTHSGLDLDLNGPKWTSERAEEWAKIPSLCLLTVLSLTQPSTVCLHCCKLTLPAHVLLAVHTDPGSSSSKLLPSKSIPSSSSSRCICLC